MAARDRTAQGTVPKGTSVLNGIPNGGGVQVNSWNRCQDQVGPGDNASLIVDHYNYVGGVINGGVANFTNYQADALDGLAGRTNWLYEGFPEAPTTSIAATSGGARTNPSRPYVDVIANVLELGDITGHVRDSIAELLRNHKAHKFIGNNYLRYQFGIKPIVGDLLKALNFKDQVGRRVKEINKLKSDKGLRRTVKIYGNTKSRNRNVTFQSNQGFVNTVVHQISTIEIHSHCRWLPNPAKGFDKLSNDDLILAAATRAVFGLSDPVSYDFAVSCYQAFPWSWLIDWGFSLGDYLTANRNMIPATLNSSSVIQVQTSEQTWDNYQSGSLSMTGGSASYKTIRRTPAFPTITAQFPFLSGTQMGILASLAATRS